LNIRESRRTPNPQLFQVLGFTPTLGQVRVATIILLGGDFNACTAALPDTFDTNDLCELLQALELVEIEQPSVVATRQNCDASVGGWGCELLDLCCNAGLFILNGRTPGDQSGEFICLANGGRSTVNYIVSSPVVW
jgi:hypothetical protein